MLERGFSKFYWGFIFIMLSFRIQGFDILPDVVGYIFLAMGFSSLSSYSNRFEKAAKYNIPMIILSLFSLYQVPAQGGGVQIGAWGLLSIPIAIAAFALSLLVIYNLFMGIKDMAEQRERFDLAEESASKWNHYKILQIALIFAFILIFIPPVALVYIMVLFIASIVLVIQILGFINRCKEMQD